MRKLLVLIGLLSLTSTAKSQFFAFYFEPFMGYDYSNYIKAAEPKHPILGSRYYGGVKGTLDILGYGGFNGTFGRISNDDYFVQITASMRVFRFKNSNLAAFIEAGIEYSDFGYIKTPLYLGLRQKLDERFAWTMRFRPPTAFDSHYIESTKSYTVSFDVGLSSRLFMNKKPEPLTVSGNPFILR